jgi:RNA polymerase sigma-70 factor, ECF subfamily
VIGSLNALSRDEIDPEKRRNVVSATTNQVFAHYHNDFEGAISRYSPLLFRVALRRLRNIEDAEDAVQDALLSAHKHIGQFEGRSQLSTWLTRIVTNVALMKLRRHSRYETLSLDQDQEKDDAALAHKLIDARPNPETICARMETDETLRLALAQLTPNLRSAIQMRELEGLSTREAAHALGISTNALKSRVSRARAALSLFLGEFVETRSEGTPVLVVHRKAALRRKRSSSGLGDGSVAAADPIGSRSRVCKLSPVLIYSQNETDNHARPHVECAENCYPPHSLENTTQLHPQGYAT